MRLIPLGVGEAFTARHYTTCLALGVGDDWMLIDCSHPVRKMLREGSTAAGIPLDLDRIHARGREPPARRPLLRPRGFRLLFVLRARPPRPAAHAPRGLRPRLGRAARRGDGIRCRSSPARTPVRRRLADYFDLVDLDFASPIACGPFSIECRRTIHCVPTTAFKIHAGGRTLGFSADTAFDPTLIDWLAAADLIVHEATTMDHSGVHTPYAKLAALPAELRAKMRLTHLPDDFDAGSSVIEPLRQGQCYAV